MVTSVTRTARLTRSGFGDLTETGAGSGAGLFVRADRRGGGKLLLDCAGGCAGIGGAGEDSLRRLGVGMDMEGAGVSNALAGLATGEDGGAALGVLLVVDRR